MSAISIGGGSRGGDGAADAFGAADWLSLAAAPTFAMMALLATGLGGGAAPLCSGTGGSPFGGMAPMYLLMSAFHVSPWLRLILVKRGVSKDAPGGAEPVAPTGAFFEAPLTRGASE